MNAFISALDATINVARIVFLALAVVATGICVTDWAVRTRRINPFSAVARFFRGSIDPLLAPIERRLVRSGGIPSNAPWWGLGVVVVGGILLISLLGFVRGQITTIAFAFDSGPRGILQLVVGGIFTILQAALMVRVIVSWFPRVANSPWLRWSFTLSEPILRPLRRFIPPIGGMLDITPIVAYFLLKLLSVVVLSAL
ncbi:MAG TPA: YggT family protein [Gemmatimonadaceae bacterium]|nr:YggT family protein [Gemmatimonadaceae bacterium]